VAESLACRFLDLKVAGSNPGGANFLAAFGVSYPLAFTQAN